MNLDTFPFLLRCYGLPQQVALTEFKGQVSAKVKVIIVTELNANEFLTIMVEFLLGALVIYNYPNK